MPVNKRKSTMNVLEAAKKRIKNVFDTGVKIYLSFSSGKDSLCLSSLTYDLIRSGEISGKQLKVIFIDEEGLYPSMVEAAERWKRKFESIGVPFLWYCLEFKQVCTLDHLSSSESWITWEQAAKDRWMRTPPKDAITSHPLMTSPGCMNYQTFCGKVFNDGICMIGLRSTESLTRYQCIAKATFDKPTGKFYPIYDWSDNDVWLYIRERGLEFPEIYMRLYEAGVSKRQLRLCAFFGDMTTQGLRWIAETDNDLWQKIERRMPNAYLVLLYWDSEMFRRSSKARKELEADQERKDYKALCKDLLFLNTDKYTIAKDTKAKLDSWRSLFIKSYGIATQKHYQKMYEGILYGDPKMRVLRILWQQIYQDYNEGMKRGAAG